MNGHQPVEPICVRVNDAARMIGIGRTKLYELISSGELETVCGFRGHRAQHSDLIARGIPR